MSYQEYAQLGKGRSTGTGRSSSARRSESVERPYHVSHGSFSVPRRSPPTSHSTNSSTSSASLSPSNSASQKGGLRRAPTKEVPGDGPDSLTSIQLKELERNPGRNLGKKPDLIEVPLPWRPFYLQRRILISFFAVFAAIIVALEALLDYSSRNAGLLGPSDQNMRYVWAFVPTAVLTIIAALWSRAEYQAKLAAPWLRLARSPPAEAQKSLLLDYVSVSRPWAVVQSFRNRDFTVASTVLVSLILKISIVISTAIVSLTLVYGSDENAPITIQTAFVNNATGLSSVAPLALFAMLGLEQDNLTFPDGVSSQFAYQQFVSDLPTTTEFHATVDGFSASLDCEPAQLSLNGVQNTNASVQFNTTFTAPDCAVTMPILSQSFSGTGSLNRTHFFARFGRGSCGNSSDVSNQRIVVFFGIGSVDPRSRIANLTVASTPVSATIPQSQQLICKPSYSVSKVDVVKNGTFLESIVLSDNPQTRTLDGVRPWDVAQALFDSFRGPAAARISDTTTPYFQPQVVNTDAPMYLALGMQSMDDSNVTAPTDLLDVDKLQGLANQYFQLHAALLARNGLTEPTSVQTTCTAVLSGDRLIVGVVAVQILVVLLALIILLNVVVICLVPAKGFLPRDPGAILDIATLLAHSKPLLQSLRGSGGGSLATLRERLDASHYYTGVEAYDRGSAESGQGYFKILGGQGSPESAPEYVEQTSKWPYPLGLHPLQRLFALVLVGGLIAALEVTLRISARNNGFGPVTDGHALHYAWTIVPAVVVSVLALFFVSVDFNIRALAPYAELTREGSGSFKSMTTNLLDKAEPTLLYESIASRRFAVFGAAGAAAVGSLLVVFTAALFQALTMPAMAPIELVTLDFFSNSTGAPSPQFCTNCTDGTLLSSLILSANLSFPPFTFDDLAFPTVSLIPLIRLNTTDDDELTVAATMPAARASMTCQFFSQPQITVNLTTNYRIGNIINPLRIDLPGEPKLGTSELQASALILGTARTSSSIAASPSSLTEPPLPIDPNAFFGMGAFRPFKTADGTNVSHWVYAWGQLSNANSNQTKVTTISALACNESMQQVGALTTFLGPGLVIDPQHPPVPLESTAVPSTVALSTNLNYGDLARLPSPHLLDGFFGALVSSRFAVPAADLGSADPATARDVVAAAITAQHRRIRAQVVSTWNRRATTASSRPADVFPTDVNGAVMGNAAQVAVPANLTSLGAGTRRVVQDVLSTRVLQALLGAVLALSLLGWAASSSFSAGAIFSSSRDGIISYGRLLPPGRTPTSVASVAALLADGNVFGFLARGAEWQPAAELQALFRDGVYVTAGFSLGWQRVRRRGRTGRPGRDAAGGGNGNSNDNDDDEAFGIRALRTGGWGGGEAVGLGLQARVGYAQRRYVRDLGWRT